MFPVPQPSTNSSDGNLVGLLCTVPRFKGHHLAWYSLSQPQNLEGYAWVWGVGRSTLFWWYPGWWQSDKNLMKIIALRCNLLRQIQEASPALSSAGTDIINFINIKYIETDTCSGVSGFIAVQLHWLQQHCTSYNQGKGVESYPPFLSITKSLMLRADGSEAHVAPWTGRRAGSEAALHGCSTGYSGVCFGTLLKHSKCLAENTLLDNTELIN